MSNIIEFLKDIDYTHIIVQVIMVYAFLTIFFFTYVKTVEEQIIKDQVTFLMDDLSNNLQLLPSNAQDIFKTKINEKMNIDMEDMYDLDATVEENNNAIMMQSMYILAGALGAAIVFISLMYYFYGTDVKELIISSSIVIAAVAVVEFSFLTFLVKNYILADRNYVKKVVIDKLIKIRDANSVDISYSEIESIIKEMSQDASVVKKTVEEVPISASKEEVLDYVSESIPESIQETIEESVPASLSVLYDNDHYLGWQLS